MALVLVTVLTYFGVWKNGFVDYDDNSYVFLNSHINRGFDWEAVKWAFTGVDANLWLWYPLTWLSLALDCQCYGLNPAGFHITNLILHTANVLLVFFFLRRTTGSIWRSAFVAALFGAHPLHVESVAWVTERKDVLSGLFFMLTLLAYAGYATRAEGSLAVNQALPSDPVAAREGRGTKRERDPNSKQDDSLPTAPRNLRLACRFYYLALFFFACGLMSKSMLVTVPCVLLLLDYWPLRRFQLQMKNQESRIKNLLREKAPFFALTVISSVISAHGQARAVTTSGTLPAQMRLANAMLACTVYLRQTCWPTKLAVFYHPEPASFHQVVTVTALTVLAILTLGALVLARKAPFVPVGWFWYAGMLVPVSGIVQVGAMVQADHFTYLPLIGVFILIAWGLTHLTQHRPRLRLAVEGTAVVAAVALAVTAHQQVGVWRNTQTLFTHAASVTRDNYVALSSLANLDLERGHTMAALTNAEHVLQIAPKYAKAEYLVGSVLQMQGKMQEAVPYLEASVGVEVGVPGRARLVLSYLDAGRLTDAEGALDAVMQARPGVNALLMKAALLREEGRIDEAKQLFRELEDHHPKYILDNPTSNFELAELYALQGLSRQAASFYSAAIEICPHFTNALNNFAWLLATDPDDHVRNGARAVELAERACQLTEWKRPVFMGTLAAAYAEAGRFDDAVAMAGRARDLAKAVNQETVAARNAELLDLYRQHKAFREKNS
jgi:tetratricopeptide (TPR) repeat protein